LRRSFAICFVFVAGCASLKSAFECDANSDCVDGTQGVCETSGFCSFPDSGCPSGRRYGRFAGAGLGDSCVDGSSDGGMGDAAIAVHEGCAQSLAGGLAHVCAVRADSAVYCWGAGADGRLGGLVDQPLPQPVLNAQKTPLQASRVTLGDAHSCAVAANQTISCWGANLRGQLGVGASPSPQPVPSLLGLNPVVRAAAGSQHACAVVGANELLWCWGANNDRQLSDGTTDDSGSPRPALAPNATQLAKVAALTGGRAHTCALVDGTAWCWGRNAEGQLGNGNSGATPVPVMVNGPPTVRRLVAGGHRTCALTDGGAVWC
jgi:alpha-tubulin suppressor-like RCC1 family protein